MPKVPIWLAAMAALLLPPALAAKPAPDRALAEGTVISSQDDAVIGGWRRIYGATYAKRIRRDQSVEEVEECCFAVFDKGNATLVLRTEAVSRDSSGRVLSERIVRSKWITRKPSETITDCQILWISPQPSPSDNKPEPIRSLAIANGEFVVISWRDPGSSCSHGD